MAFGNYAYNGYQSPYYSQPMPGQIGQIPQNQMQPQPMQMQGGNPPTQNMPAVGNPAMPQTPQMSSNQFGMGMGMNSNGILWCRNREEALAWPVAPNNAVALWDMNAPFIYLKQADATGKPTITPYELVDRSQDANASQSYTQQSNGQMQMQEANSQTQQVAQTLPEDYVTKEDIQAIQDRIDELEKQIQAQEVVYIETPAEHQSEPEHKEAKNNTPKTNVRSKRVTINKGE